MAQAFRLRQGRDIQTTSFNCLNSSLGYMETLQKAELDNVTSAMCGYCLKHFANDNKCNQNQFAGNPTIKKLVFAGKQFSNQV